MPGLSRVRARTLVLWVDEHHRTTMLRYLVWTQNASTAGKRRTPKTTSFPRLGLLGAADDQALTGFEFIHPGCPPVASVTAS